MIGSGGGASIAEMSISTVMLVLAFCLKKVYVFSHYFLDIIVGM